MNKSRILQGWMKLIIMGLLFMAAGCAQNAARVADGQIGQDVGMGTLQSLMVHGKGEAAVIEITADRPLTYTSYQMTDPPRAIIDFSQTEPGTVVTSQEVNDELIKEIKVTRQEVSGGVITRGEIILNKEVEFFVTSDENDKRKLLFSFTKEPSVVQKEAETAVEPPSAEAPAVAVADNIQPSDTPAPAGLNPIPEATAVPVPEVKAKPAKQIKSVTISGEAVQVVADGFIADVKSFILSNPSRLVIDLFGVKNGLTAKNVTIGRFGVTSARVGAYPDKVRLVFDSPRKGFPEYQLDKGEKGITLAFGAARKKSAVTDRNKAGRPLVESVDFIAKEDMARIAVKIQGAPVFDEPKKLNTGLVFTLKNTVLPKNLERILNAQEFFTAVERVTPYQVKVNGRPDTKILVRLKKEVPYSVKQEEGIIYLDIVTPEELRRSVTVAPTASSVVPPAETQKPATEAAVAAAPLPAPSLISPPVEPLPAVAPADEAKKPKPAPVRKKDDSVEEESAEIAISEKNPSRTNPTAKKRYTGRRVTLEFADAEVRKIFQLIAEVSNLNFLIGDDVGGTISIKLVNVPWDQALDIILDTKGLGMQRDGNVVIIRPKNKIMSLADEEQAIKRSRERAMELRTEVFDVNFASIGDVSGQFNGLKSERGTVTVDSRTNRVIVKDIATALDDMRFLLKTLDTPEKQVMIEARIVEASSNFTRDLGVQWGIHYRDASASTAMINQMDTGFGGIVSVPPTSGFPSPSSSGLSTGISFGKITSNVQVDMRLSAAVTTGDVKIISTPKVVTLNNKAAKISQGQSIPYQTTSAEGTKTEFVEAALTLEVTPHITADGSVVMKIKASNNSPGSGTPPPINKKEATTELLVKNGETTVIGGIYVDSDTEADRGVPFLKDIPLLGWMFKSNTKSKTKTELLIFITPKILV